MTPSLKNDGQAPQGVDTSMETTDNQATEGNITAETFYQGNNEAAAATADDSNNFNDSGFFEDGDSFAHKADYTDWILFPDNLPTIDVDTDNFFADADASARANYNALYDGGVSESTANSESHGPSGLQATTFEDEDTLFSDTVNE